MRVGNYLLAECHSADARIANNFSVNPRIAKSISADAHAASYVYADVKQNLHANSAYAASANRSVFSAVEERDVAQKDGTVSYVSISNAVSEFSTHVRSLRRIAQQWTRANFCA